MKIKNKQENYNFSHQNEENFELYYENLKKKLILRTYHQSGFCRAIQNYSVGRGHHIQR